MTTAGGSSRPTLTALVPARSAADAVGAGGGRVELWAGHPRVQRWGGDVSNAPCRGRSGLHSADYPAFMRLAVGDAVVYTTHGVGRVAGREQKLVLGLQ